MKTPEITPEAAPEVKEVAPEPVEMQRKFTADEEGNYTPTPPPAEPTGPTPPHDGYAPPFDVGSAVCLTGVVQQIIRTQGEEWNVRIEVDGNELWVPHCHLKQVTGPKENKAVKGPGETK